MFQEIDKLKIRLKDYITADYHISHPALINMRRVILEESDALVQKPFIESTARYQAVEGYSTVDVSDKLKRFYKYLADKRVIFPTPYTHQAKAIELIHSVKKSRNVIVTTGTGSGKR